MPTPVLVTGAAGFLGWHATRALQARGVEVVGTSRDGAGMPPGTAARALSLDDGGTAGAALVRELRPRAVLHLAAIASADACAREPERCRRVNVTATRRLAEAARAVGAFCCFSSSDLVFDGSAAPYREADPPAPRGAYMQSKVDAERALLEVDPSFLAVRVALIYGLAGGRKGCFFDGLVARLEAGEPSPLFVDQFRTPVYVEDAAAILAELVELRPGGLLHLGGPERVSRHAHGTALARALGADPALCRPTRAAELQGLAPRPPDVSLDVSRLGELLGRPPLSVAEGCARLVAWRRR